MIEILYFILALVVLMGLVIKGLDETFELLALGAFWVYHNVISPLVVYPYEIITDAFKK